MPKVVVVVVVVVLEPQRCLRDGSHQLVFALLGKVFSVPCSLRI